VAGAGEELFRAYYADVYRYLYRLCHDASLAEDLAQETFLSAVRALAAFRGEAAARTWLFSIARRAWLTHLRRTRGRDAAPMPEDALPAPEDSPEAVLLRRETAERIAALLRAESERTRGMMEMRLRGCSYGEIARAFGVSESSARVICFRARARIREILEKEGLDGE